MLVDGKPLKLKKMRGKIKVTRRGTTTPVMDGHVKNIGSIVPVKAKNTNQSRPANR